MTEKISVTVNLFHIQLVVHAALRGRASGSGHTSLNQYPQKQSKSAFRNLMGDAFLISCGIGSAAFGLKGFLMNNQFIDGGATGISLLVCNLTEAPLFVLLPIVNLPFVVLAHRMMGRKFAVKTAFAVVCLALVVGLVTFPAVTNDKLLVAVFGGFFLGAGIGLAVRGGAVIDGTEVLAIFLSKRFGTTLGDIIIVINVLVFSAAAYFLNVEVALYSMITYLAASRTLDYIVIGFEEYIGVTIVSSRSELISRMITRKLGRGITMYKGKRGMIGSNEEDGKETDVIYSVITRLELHKLNLEIEKIDPNAFVVMSSVKDTKGGMIKKRPYQH